MRGSSIGAFELSRWQRAAVDRRSAAATLGFGLVVVLGFADGGYYPSSWRWAGLALGAVAGLGLLRSKTFRPGLFATVSLVSLSLLGVWMGSSALWGIAGTESRTEAERCALYVAALAALIAVARARETTALLYGVLTGCTALAGFALGDRALSDAPLDPYQGALLREPIGYANSLGVITAIGLVLAIGLGRESQKRAERTVLTAAAIGCGLALVLTSSRGALLAALIGVAALLVCRRSSVLVLITVASSGLLLVLGAAFASPGDRSAYWKVAASAAAESPVTGTGAGSFDDVWLTDRPIPAFVRDAHSLYLETAAELGVVGLVLLLCALGAPLAAAARARTASVVPPAAAGYTVFLVHAGLDWDWEMPVTVLAGLACAAVLLATPPRLSRS